MKKLYNVSIILGMIVMMGIIPVYADETENLIPDWFKTSLAYYLDGKTTDKEFISSFEFLAKEGIINIEKKEYDPFSLEKFPNTGGFNPEWLDGERIKITKSCNEAKSMGYENPYCKYL